MATNFTSQIAPMPLIEPIAVQQAERASMNQQAMQDALVQAMKEERSQVQKVEKPAKSDSIQRRKEREEKERRDQQLMRERSEQEAESNHDPEDIFFGESYSEDGLAQLEEGEVLSGNILNLKV